jgi:hypothetical protein
LWKAKKIAIRCVHNNAVCNRQGSDLGMRDQVVTHGSSGRKQKKTRFT